MIVGGRLEASNSTARRSSNGTLNCWSQAAGEGRRGQFAVLKVQRVGEPAKSACSGPKAVTTTGSSAILQIGQGPGLPNLGVHRAGVFDRLVA